MDTDPGPEEVNTEVPASAANEPADAEDAHKPGYCPTHRVPLDRDHACYTCQINLSARLTRQTFYRVF